MRGAEGGVNLVLSEVGILYDFPEVGFVGGEALEDELFEGMLGCLNGGLTGLAVADEFGDHGVVSLTHGAGTVDAAVHAGASDLWLMVGSHLAWSRQEAVFGVLGVDTEFDGMTLEWNHLLGPAHLLTAGDADLLLHDVDAGAHFGHGMFHLDAGVHFQKVEVQVLVDDELHGASVFVAYALAEFHCGGQQLLALFFRQGG